MHKSRKRIIAKIFCSEKQRLCQYIKNLWGKKKFGKLNATNFCLRTLNEIYKLVLFLLLSDKYFLMKNKDRVRMLEILLYKAYINIVYGIPVLYLLESFIIAIFILRRTEIVCELLPSARNGNQFRRDLKYFSRTFCLCYLGTPSCW